MVENVNSNENQIANSSENIVEYIVYRYMEIAKNVGLLRDSIANQNIDGILFEKVVSDINIFISEANPYLSEEVKEIVLKPKLEKLKTVFMVWDKITNDLYKKGILKVERQFQFKTYDLAALMKEVVNENVKILEEENTRLKAKIQQLKDEIKKLKENDDT